MRGVSEKVHKVPGLSDENPRAIGTEFAKQVRPCKEDYSFACAIIIASIFLASSTIVVLTKTKTLDKTCQR